MAGKFIIQENLERHDYSLTSPLHQVVSRYLTTIFYKASSSLRNVLLYNYIYSWWICVWARNGHITFHKLSRHTFNKSVNPYYHALYHIICINSLFCFIYKRYFQDVFWKTRFVRWVNIIQELFWATPS